MKEVSREAFYARINPLDVVGFCQPAAGVYRTELKTRDGTLVAATEWKWNEETAKYERHYYLS